MSTSAIAARQSSVQISAKLEVIWTDQFARHGQNHQPDMGVSDAVMAEEETESSKIENNDSFDYPADTPIAQMTEPQQAEYWREKAQKHEKMLKSERATQSSYVDNLREKAKQYDALLATTQTDQERAVETAKQEAKAAAQLEAAPRLVRAEFKAAAKGVLDDKQLAALLEDRDLTKYVTDDGDVDEDRVAKIVADAAPRDQQQRHVALGQGRTGRTDVKPSVTRGREMYEAERAKRRKSA